MTETKWGKALTGPEMMALGLPDGAEYRIVGWPYTFKKDEGAFFKSEAVYHLPADHPAYTVHETNKRTGSRFKFHAGERVPSDWDRGNVLVNDTHPRIINGDNIDECNWAGTKHRAKIIGYTRKVDVRETPVDDHQSGLMSADDTQADTVTIKRMTDEEFRTIAHVTGIPAWARKVGLIREETREEQFTRTTGYAVTDAVAAALNWGR